MSYHNRLIATLLLWFIPSLVWAQFEKTYTPLPIQDTIPSALYTQLQQKNEKDKLAVQEPNKKANKYLKSLYDDRLEYVTTTFNEDHILLDAEVTPYLQKIIDNIYQANPKLPRETHIYAYRSNIPNALSFGDGTLAINLGLLVRLENESQIAFALCHEMAHYHQKHCDKRLKELTQLNYDKDLAKQISTARNSTYNSNTQSKQLLKNLQLSMTSNSRTDELEADSVGLALFLHTNYDLQAPVQCIAILDSSDTELYPHIIDLKKHFHSPSYPFKDSWLVYEKSTMWHASEEDKEFFGSDTMRTHPDCQKRIVALQRQIKASGNTLAGHANLQDQELNTRIRLRSRFEIIESYYHFRKYGKALFQALLALETYPDNAYLHAMVSKCLCQIYTYQKNHEVGKVLPLPDPRFDENYDRFLTFMHQLRLTELASLAYTYAESKKEALYNDEEFVYAWWLCSQLPVSKSESAKVSAHYRSKFPKGKYLSSIQ